MIEQRMAESSEPWENFAAGVLGKDASKENQGTPKLVAWLSGLLLACFFLMGSPNAPAAAPVQQANLRSAQAQIRSAFADLRAAQGSAGTAARPAKGSRRRLTLMRLASAKQRLAKAGQLLAGFPANHPAANSLRQAQAKGLKALAQIQAILAGAKTPPVKQPTPPTNPGAKPTPKAPQQPVKTAPRLGYKQEELLKNARYYLRETARYLKPAQTTLARIDGSGPKPVVAEVNQASTTVQRAITKYNLAVGYIKKLPAAHPKVAGLREKIQTLGQTLAAVNSRLKAEARRLGKLTGLGNYPKYQQDFTLLGGLSQRYGNFQMLTQRPEQLAKVIREDSKALQEIRRIAKTYQPLADQKTQEGKTMEKRLLYALQKRKGFIKDLKAYMQTLPKEIDGYLDTVRRLAREGVEKKRPLYFGKNSGISQQLGFAEKKLLVLRALGEQRARPFAQKIAAVRKQVQQAAKTLEADIIANNQLPPDRYKKSDRDALIQRAIATWAKKQKGAKILTARIPSESWTRKTRWEWSNGAFHKVDYSKLQIQLILQHDDKLAVIRPINLFKDHLKGDHMTSFPFDDKIEGLLPQRFLPLSRVKK